MVMKNLATCPKIRKRWLVALVLTTWTLFFCVALDQTNIAHAQDGVIYVNGNVGGGVNNGNSWEDAYVYLQDALADAQAGDEIWVAAGVYYPDEGNGNVENNQSATFTLKSDVGVYGGFAGTEDQRAQRNFATNITVLSGDIDNNDTTDANKVVTDTSKIMGANTVSIVTATNVNAAARLDGFVLTAGSAILDPAYCASGACGGGFFGNYSSLTLANLTLSANRASYGGGIYLFGASTPTLTDILFTKNASSTFGGGIQVQGGANATLTRMKFVGNESDVWGGGAMISGATATFQDATFETNEAGTNGGGLYNLGGTVLIYDALFNKNYAQNSGGGIFSDGGSLQIERSQFTQNFNSTGSGGGIYSNESTLTLTAVDFISNSTRFNGGALFVNTTTAVVSTLIDVEMVSNRTGDSEDGLGGAFMQMGGTLKMLRATFSRNSTLIGGGGVRLLNVNATLSNVEFTGNVARQTGDSAFGGGMFIEGGNLVASNLLFSGNRAISSGGLHLLNVNGTLDSSTFAHNEAASAAGPTATARAFVIQNGSVTVSNCVAWDGKGNAIIKIANSPSSVIRYTLLEGEDSLDANGNLYTPTSPFRENADPGADGFGDNSGTPGDESANDIYGNLRLKPTSTAIDAGSNGNLPADLGDVDGDSDVAEVLPLDLDNAPRVTRFVAASERVDMGAYEYQNAAPTATLVGPHSINEGGSVALNATGSSDDGSIANYGWDCTNNGTADVNQTLPTGGSCTYPDDGTFTLRLTVTDNLNATGTANTTVTVANVAPVYTAADAQSAVGGSAKPFSLGSFTDPGAEGTWPVTVSWGDGSTSTQFTTSSAGALPTKSHTYAAAGTYNVVVTVSDGESDDLGSFVVTASAPPAGAPVVTAATAQTTTVGTAQRFNLGSFTDAGSSGPWQVTVNWGDGSDPTGLSVTASGALPAQLHTYAASGAYDVVITVNDGSLEGSSSFQVTVAGEDADGTMIFLPATHKP